MTTRAGTPEEVAVVDLAFVGAGVSTSYVLLALLAALSAHPPARPLRIAVVERDGRPWGGVAYGDRTSRTALLITAARDFLPGRELEVFLGWLEDRGSTAFTAFREAAGPVGRRWWERHRAELAAGELAHLYLPRYVFGDHLAERVEEAIARATRGGTADTRVVCDEVLAIEPTPAGHRVRGRRTTTVAREVVLAVGSPPAARRLDVPGTGPGLLVDRPHDSLTRTAQQVRAALGSRHGPGRPHVVVIGGNAGTLDVVSQLADLGEGALHGARFTVVSPRGRLPAPVPPHDGGAPAAEPFVPRTLLDLRGAPAVTARAVHDSAVADILAGEDAGVSAAASLTPVSTAVAALLPRLSEAEARAFADRWGVELGRWQRRAGWEYSEVVEDLRAAGRLSVVDGALAGVRRTPEGVCVAVAREGDVRDLSTPADVVLNCAGPDRDLRDLPVVFGMINAGTVRTTGAGRGVAVDDDLRAAPGLSVIGPLLGGNLVDGVPLWHLEHCGRISTLGNRLGTHLASLLVPPRPTGPGSDDSA